MNDVAQFGSYHQGVGLSGPPASRTMPPLHGNLANHGLAHVARLCARGRGGAASVLGSQAGPQQPKPSSSA